MIQVIFMYVVWRVRPKELQCLKHYLANLNYKYSFKDAIQRCQNIKNKLVI